METRFSSTPRTLPQAKSKMPTSKPHACANSQPSSAAWPEIWIGVSRKECDNAIEEQDRRRAYFGWLKYRSARISHHRQLRSREKKAETDPSPGEQQARSEVTTTA